MGEGFRGRGVRVAGVYARNAGKGKDLAGRLGTEWTDDARRLEKAGLCVIAVSDRAIAEVSGRLAEAGFGGTVCHTSGCMEMDALDARLAHRGVLYPLQTFSAGRKTDFSRIPIFTEASDPEAERVVREAAFLLSERVETAGTARRRALHLAAVFVNNFVNHLYAIGYRLAGEHGLPFDALAPLIRETAEKALASGDPAAVQTGPAVRGDAASMQRHLALLKDGRLREIYRLLSESINPNEYGKL